MKTAIAGVVLASALASASVVAASEESADDVKFVGTPISKDEIDDSEKRAVIATPEFLYFMKHKKYECKQGALAAQYSSVEGFVFEDATLPAEAVIAELTQRRRDGKLSCFYVTSVEFDRGLFERLEAAMDGGSLWWNEPGEPSE